MSQEKRKRFRGGRISFLFPLLVASGCAADRHPQTIFDPVTDLARTINSLQTTIFWWTMLVLAIVITALLVILVRFREQPGRPEPRKIHGNNTLEILWTLGPAVIVVLILVPTVRTIFETYRPGPEGALQVHAIGHQWWWEFRYPELDVITANQLHLPAGRPVQITLSSADVLHNFWFPRIAGKRYTYPVPRGAESAHRENFNTLVFNIEREGLYSGQCGEFCGESHALMRMAMVVTSEEDFETWVESMRAPAAPSPAAPGPAAPAPEAGIADTAVTTGAERAGVDPGQEPDTAALRQAAPGTGAEPQAAADPLVEQGRQLFRTRVCAACHAVAGVTQGRLGPSLTRFGDRWSVGAGVLENTQENVELWIREPQTVKPGARMPGQTSPGGGMEGHRMSDEDIRAVAAYLRSLK